MGKRVRVKQIRPLDDMMTSPGMKSILQGLVDTIATEARKDPNPTYTAGVQARVREQGDRAVGQVGAAPGIGTAVEAKRQTIGRAMGAVGA